MFVGHAFRQACKLLPVTECGGKGWPDERSPREGPGAFPAGLQPVRVLDLCASPGGKTTDIAASLRLRFGPRWSLVSNEVIRQRASVLADNVAVWGDPNVCVTSSDPKDFAALDGLFDIIVADVPCSGEGMFDKSASARDMFSEDNVRLCALRSRRIVADAWPSLKPGGLLVFSTCTYSREENDGNVEWICGNLGAEVVRIEYEHPSQDPLAGPQRTDHGFILSPETVAGGGQYCALLRKDGPAPAKAPGSSVASVAPGSFPEGGFPEDSFSLFDRNGEIYTLGEAMERTMGIVGRRLNVLGCGVHSFTVKGRDRVPCADLALSYILDPEDFPSVELDLQEALAFLHKEALRLPDSPRGYTVVKYRTMPLGFVNNIGSRANNLHPASRRIQKNIDRI